MSPPSLPVGQVLTDRRVSLSEDLWKQDTNKFSSPPALTESWLRPLSKLVKINTVLDMTAYIGSETIVASQVLPHAHITACEVNKDTFQTLKKNVDKYTAEGRDIVLKNTSSVEVYKGDSWDLVLCDPPFGGADYAGDKEAYRRFKADIQRGEYYPSHDGVKSVDLKLLPDVDLMPLIKAKKYAVFALKMPFNCQYSPWWDLSKETRKKLKGCPSFTIGVAKAPRNAITRGKYLSYAVRLFFSDVKTWSHPDTWKKARKVFKSFDITHISGQMIINNTPASTDTPTHAFNNTTFLNQEMIIGGQKLKNFINGVSALPDQIKQWQHFLSFEGEDVSVLDMTAGTGSLAIHFAFRKFTSKIEAYERDTDIYRLLQENISEMPEFVKQKLEIHNESSTGVQRRFNLVLCSPDVDKSGISDEDKKAYGTFGRDVFQFVMGRREDKPNCPLSTVYQNLDGTPILDFVKNMDYDVFAYEMPLNAELSPYINTPVKDVGVDNITVSIFNKGRVVHLVRLFFKNKTMFKFAKEKQEMGKLGKKTTEKTTKKTATKSEGTKTTKKTTTKAKTTTAATTATTKAVKKTATSSKVKKCLLDTPSGGVKRRAKL